MMVGLHESMSGNKVVIAMVNDDASDENTPGWGRPTTKVNTPIGHYI